MPITGEKRTKRVTFLYSIPNSSPAVLALVRTLCSLTCITVETYLGKMLKFFRWVGERLCFLGRQVDITTGLLIFAIVGFAFNGPLPSPEPKSLKAQKFSLETLRITNGPRFDMYIDSELVEDGIIFPENMPSSTTQQVAPAEDFSWPDRKLDINDPGTCSHELSGFTPALVSTTVPVCNPTSQHENVCEIEQSENHLSDSASSNKLEKNRLHAFVNYVFSLKHNFLSLLTLLLLLAGGMFGFIRRWPVLGIGVAIILVFGDGISWFLTCKNSHPATSFQYDCATLIYIIAHSLMFLSLILKQAERVWLSHLMSGLAYACVTLGIVGFIISCLTWEYACVVVSMLFFFVIFTVRCGYNPDRTD